MPFQSKEIQNKAKETCLERYQVDNPFKSREIQEKIKNKNLKNIGVENPFFSDKIQATIQEKILSIYGGMGAASEMIKEKMRETNLEKYGIENTWQLPYVQSNECWQKRNATLRKTGNHSNLETYFEEKLQILGYVKNKDYLVQYKEKRYPYHCDFYLLDKDLFVEINGWWSHGKHWFDSNNQNDIEIIQEWKQKSDDNQYSRAIIGWTVSDVEKRETARKSELNYVVLWNKQDIDDWFNLNCPLGQDWREERTWKK